MIDEWRNHAAKVGCGRANGNSGISGKERAANQTSLACRARPIMRGSSFSGVANQKSIPDWSIV